MASDAKVEHVVLDAPAFFKHLQLQTIGKNLYTIKEVVDEIKDKNTLQRLAVLPYGLTIKAPSPESYNIVTEFSKLTGDYPTLSLTDKKVLALTYEITKATIGVDHLRKVPEKTVVADGNKLKSAEVVGFYNSSGDVDDEDEEETWITPTNIQKVKREDEDANQIPVACLTTDFAMQNVLMHMGLHVVSAEGLQIKERRTFILRCHACFKTTTAMTKVFCPNCGNNTLKRVSVSINSSGQQIIHLSRRPINIRGKKFSLPAPQGGKHGSNPLLCEDQRFPHQRVSNLTRCVVDALSPDYVSNISPFGLKDVSSRASYCGKTQCYFDRRNPNQNRKTSNKRK